MFQDAYISNFRGIKNCSFQRFSQVNIFYGKNNSGKSTVLESLFLLSGISNPIILLNENNMRAYSRIDERDIASFFHNFDEKTPIEFRAQEDNSAHNIRSIQITPIEKDITIFSNENFEKIPTNTVRKEYGLVYKFSVGDSFSRRIPLIVEKKSNSFSATVPRIKGYEEKFQTIFLAPQFQFQIVLEKLAEIIKNKEKEPIIEGLKILSADVKDIAIINAEVFVDVGLSQMIPLKLMGDGMRKLIAIFISIFSCKNGAVIIDEIDNGLHFTAIQPLLRLISTLCKKLNVQFFASTHSKEILEQLFASNDIDLKQFNIYTLFKNDDETTARCFNGPDAKNAYQNWGLELR